MMTMNMSTFKTLLNPYQTPCLLSVSASVLALASIVSIAPSQAAPSLVMDIDTGRVIMSEQATDPWFPASVTKLMTAYVALKAVRDGHINLDTPLIVSKRAASAAPSKMGLRAGTQVTLDNALKMIMVKSANDMAVTIAEGVGGSVDEFAAMMNAEASRLGMRESHFVNPNGLPASNQKTSARDLAVLGSALLRDFPDQGDLWGIGAIQLGKRVMPNTNGLIGRYYGAQGMKTGFICSSGFNVVATATRSGRRLLVVVLGSQSATERTIKASELLDQGFASSGHTGSSLSELPQGYGSPPDMRGEICNSKRRNVALADVDEFIPSGSNLTGGNTENAALEMLIPQSGATFGLMGATRPRLGQRQVATPITVYTGPNPAVNLAARGPNVSNTAEKKTKERTRVASRNIREVPKPKGVASIIDGDTQPKTQKINNKNTAKTTKTVAPKTVNQKVIAKDKLQQKNAQPVKSKVEKAQSAQRQTAKPKPLDD